MHACRNDYRELNDKIALIATSGFRAISLACQLGNTRNTPKIILIDNSKNVYKFWYAFREFTRNHPSKELFFENLPSFLKSNTHLCRQINLSDIYNVGLRTVQYPNQDITAYFNEMIKEYSYEHVRNIINHTTLIKQSWFDTATLAKIKNILNYLNINKIYVYPSNILSMTWNPLDRYLLLDNIKELSPVLSIHTDFCDVHEMPEKVSLYTNQCPTHIENSIFSNMICKQKDPKNFIQVTFTVSSVGKNSKTFELLVNVTKAQYEYYTKQVSSSSSESESPSTSAKRGI